MSWKREVQEILGDDVRFGSEEYDVPGFKAKVVLLRSKDSRYIGFLGEELPSCDGLRPLFKCGPLSLYPFDFDLYHFLGKFLFHLKPKPLDRRPSFGCGDRLGMVSQAHVRALAKFPVFPVLAQQSPRELERTCRTFANVLLDAVWGVLEEGYKGPFGADADHIKDEASLREARDLGFSMYTLDLSEKVNMQAFKKDVSVLRRWFGALSPLQKDIFKRYAGKQYTFAPGVTVDLSEERFFPVFLAYLPALEEAERLFAVLREGLSDFSLEISLDEGGIVTSLEAHFFVASELRRRGVDFQSLAPRFPGSFEKGIDYVGDVREFARMLYAHTVIQRSLGGYRLSLHSGSDKFSIYSIFAQETGGVFHVKTSGTSWLSALETIAVTNPELFVRMYRIAYEAFEENTKAYQVSVRKEELPEAIDPGEDLSRLFFDPGVRQLLHISYGSILNVLGRELQETLWENEERHYKKVQENIEKHLQALFGGKARFGG